MPSNSGTIKLILSGSTHDLVGLDAMSFHALVDLLRNERPVYYNADDDTVHTLSELVGEVEMKH